MLAEVADIRSKSAMPKEPGIKSWRTAEEQCRSQQQERSGGQ